MEMYFALSYCVLNANLRSKCQLNDDSCLASITTCAIRALECDIAVRNREPPVTMLRSESATILDGRAEEIGTCPSGRYFLACTSHSIQNINQAKE
jgi:hypothetical protein